MSTRFAIDLVHPGHVADTWQDWFIGSQGRRRWVIAAAGCGIVLVVVIALILPTRIRLSQDVGAIPRLRADLAARQGDLNVLRANAIDGNVDEHLVLSPCRAQLKGEPST